MEKVLTEQIVRQLEEAFTEMKEPVHILYFGAQENCQYCADTLQLLQEVAAASDKLDLSVYDLRENRDVADRFNVTNAPGIVIAARDGAEVSDLGVQYSGIPAGHEFSTLISDILLVSKRDSGLDARTRAAYLQNLDQPLLLQVFVTPGCPYCPRAVLLAHQMAMENPRMVRAEGVEATEFPELAGRFNVRGVPQTVINSGAGTVVGAVPEGNLLAEIQRVLEINSYLRSTGRAMTRKNAHRKSKRQFPLGPVFFGVFLISMALLFRIPPVSGDAPESPLGRAPELSLESIDGRMHTLADYRQDVVLVNNWALWCPPCKAEMPVLETYYAAHAAQGFMVIAVDAGDAKDGVIQFARVFGLTFQVWLDPDNASLRAFGNSRLPNSYVIDRSGAIRYAWTGQIDLAMLDEYVTPLLLE